MKPSILTISRQFGSGGRTIGRQAAETLGIPCYDQALVEKIAQESGFAQSYLEEKAEELPGGGHWLADLLTSQAEFMNQDLLWEIQRQVILDLADAGPCVLVGRCADYILRERADCLTVFIHAPLAQRAQRIVRLYGERPESPEKRLRDKDKRRAAYYRFHTDRAWGDAAHYHLCLDSGRLGVDTCVEVITGLYQRS